MGRATIRFVAASHIGATEQLPPKRVHHAHSGRIYWDFEVKTKLPEPKGCSAFLIVKCIRGVRINVATSVA